MQDAYASLVLAECPLVLGKRMLPFSLWHAHALEAFGSPLLDGKPAGAEDIVLAAWICSRSHAQAVEVLRNRRPDIAAECKTWGSTVTRSDIAAAHKTLREYITAHMHTVYRHGVKPSDSAAQWTMVYLLYLCAGRYDAETIAGAWDTPINLAYCLNVTSAIMNGDETYFTEKAEADFQAARAAVAEGANGNG